MENAILVSFWKHYWEKFWFRFLVWSCIISIPLLYFFKHTRYYMPFLSDDSLISLRYAQRLLEGKGLTWTDGHPVEGYSNLLWVLLTAGMGFFGIDLVQGARILGFVCMSGVLAAALFGFKKMFPHRSPLYLLPAFFVFVFSGTFAIWAVGGLEQPLIALLLAWALVFCFIILKSEKPHPSTVWMLSLCLGLLTITRPDGPIFTAGIVISGLMIWGFHKSSIQRLLKICIFPFLLFGGQLVFRYFNYGEWVPNTALVKISPSGIHLIGGLKYIWLGFVTHMPVSILGIVFLLGLLLDRKTRTLATVLVITDILWLLYLVFIGGDFFLGFRHMVPIMVICVFIFVLSAVHVWDRVKRNIFRIGLIFIILFSLVLYHRQQFHFDNQLNKKAVYERWEWDGEIIGRFLKQAFGSAQPLLAVDAAGALPYWSELPCLDMLGLNDYYIPRHVPENFGKGQIGHELGDGRYVLEKKPDLMMFAIPPGLFETRFRGGLEMLADPEFHRYYTKVHFRIKKPREVLSKFWINKYSGKIGIRYQEDEIIMPAFLFSGDESSAAYLNSTNDLVVAIVDSIPLHIKDIKMPPGNWKAENYSDILVSVKPGNHGLYNILVETASDIPIEIQAIRLFSEK